ncbi:hypothetical protein AB0K14_35335 [Actinosynnema sp. NPDC050801]|uniref:hypothetical protein n=1 Tax=unclassified Actinosynnema TaxID=2637065 RepID=UPI0033FD0484
MTILLPTPRNLAFIASLGLLDKLRVFLAARLTRTPSRARHRVLSPRQIRWRRWKFIVAHHLSPTAPVGRAPRPDPPVQPNVQAFLTSRWNALHPPPRTAQSAVPAEPVDDHWTDPQALAAPCDLASEEPEVWFGECPEVWPEEWSETSPETSPVTWPEASPETWPETSHVTWSEPWPEVRPEQVDDRFTDYLDDLAATEPSVGRHRLRTPVTLRSLADALAEYRAAVALPVAEPAFTQSVLTQSALTEPILIRYADEVRSPVW